MATADAYWHDLNAEFERAGSLSFFLPWEDAKDLTLGSSVEVPRAGGLKLNFTWRVEALERAGPLGVKVSVAAFPTEQQKAPLPGP